MADDERGTIRDYAWSPKGAYLAFSMTDANESRSIHVWSALDGKLHRVTGELFNEEQPAWDPDGESLFYLSDRSFAPQISSFEWNFADEPHHRHLRGGAASRTARAPSRRSRTR